MALDRPEYGCGASACDACHLPSATAKCEASACAVAQCLGTSADCDGKPANGCEANLNSSANCGTCGKTCPTGQVCNATQCAFDCGVLLECSGGCVDILTDVAHCGGCNQACVASPGGASPKCIAGSCV